MAVREPGEQERYILKNSFHETDSGLSKLLKNSYVVNSYLLNIWSLRVFGHFRVAGFLVTDAGP